MWLLATPAALQATDLKRLELATGETLYGHVVDRADQKIHVAGATINRWIPLRDLSPKTLLQLGFAPGDLNAGAGLRGLNVTREKLTLSEQQYQTRFIPVATVNTIPSFYYLTLPLHTRPCFFYRSFSPAF